MYSATSIRHNAIAAGANARPKVKLVGSAARVVCTGQLFARVQFYSAFIQLECSDRRQGGLAQSLSPVPSEPRLKWMKVTAKPPQLGNRLGFFKNRLWAPAPPWMRLLVCFLFSSKDKIISLAAFWRKNGQDKWKSIFISGSLKKFDSSRSMSRVIFTPIGLNGFNGQKWLNMTKKVDLESAFAPKYKR